MPQPAPEGAEDVGRPEVAAADGPQVDAAGAPGEERERDRAEQVGEHDRERLVHGSLTARGWPWRPSPREEAPAGDEEVVGAAQHRQHEGDAEQGVLDAVRHDARAR